MARSIAAVVAGFLLIGALSFGADTLVHQFAPGAYDASGRLVSVPLLLLTQAYVALFAIGGCYLCARLAPSHPLRHALILGALGLVFNVFGSYARWNELPLWFHVMGLTLTLPFAYAGGWLREREVARQVQPAVATAA